MSEKTKIRSCLDIIWGILVFSVAITSSFDVIEYFIDSRAAHTARFCNRACRSEFDSSAINVGIEGKKISCNCEGK